MKSLQNKGFYLIAISSNPETLKKIEAQSLAQRFSSSLKDTADADVVFVCSPISAVVGGLKELEAIVSPTTIVTDVASVKGFICEEAQKLNLNFIGSHPMAGTENKGFDSAEEDLFNQAKWVLTPFDNSSSDDVNILKSIIESMGAVVLQSSPKEHDEAVALISHMPMLLSQSLFSLLLNYENAGVKELAQRLASSGFRDMSRLAMSNTQMACDMLNYNAENVQLAMDKLAQSSRELSENYTQSNLEKIASNRREMYSKEGKNVY